MTSPRPYHVSDYVMVLYKGHVVEAGPPKDVIGDPAAYLYAASYRLDPMARGGPGLGLGGRRARGAR